MLHDDGDIIRGLGFVTLYSAWVEEAIDGLLHTMATVEPFDERKQRWAISRKLERATELRRLNSRDLDGLLEAPKDAIFLLEKEMSLCTVEFMSAVTEKIISNREDPTSQLVKSLPPNSINSPINS